MFYLRSSASRTAHLGVWLTVEDRLAYTRRGDAAQRAIGHFNRWLNAIDFTRARTHKSSPSTLSQTKALGESAAPSRLSSLCGRLVLLAASSRVLSVCASVLSCSCGRYLSASCWGFADGCGLPLTTNAKSPQRLSKTV